MLTHGVCTSLGSGCVFYPAVSAVNMWFQRRRSVALGTVMSGACAGGIIFPLLLTFLVPRIGFTLTMIAGASISSLVLVFAYFAICTRSKPRPTRISLSEYAEPFADPRFVLLALGAACGYCCMFLAANFLPVMADSHGIDDAVVGLLLVALNAGSWPGRILPTYLADKLGRFNMAMVACALTTVLVLCVWLVGVQLAPSSSAVYLAFSTLFGFSSGATVALLPSLLGVITPGSAGIGLRQGVMFSIVAVVCLAGGPLGGTVLDAGGPVALQVLDAGLALLAMIFFSLARWLIGTRDADGGRKPFSLLDKH